MENKKYLVITGFLACVFSSLAMSSTASYDKEEVGVQNGFALEGHHVSRKSTMNLVYTPDLLHEADYELISKVAA